jgi:hypothetical protein
MKKYTPAIILLIVSLMTQGCHLGTSGTWANDRIDQSVKNQIDVLNKKLFESIASKDIPATKLLMAPVLLEKSGKSIDTIVNAFGDNFKGTQYEILDEYYTKNTTTKVTNTLFPVRKTSEDYIIQYLALNEEMYVSVLVSKDLPVNFVMLAIYGKYNDGWKINILQLGQYSILGKTAPEYYNKSLVQYKKGNLIEAVDLIVMAGQIAHPGGTYFKYKNEDDMAAFYTKVLQEANTKYHFPVTLDKVKSKPQIFSINPQLIEKGDNKGIFPIVGYKSAIALNDTVALKAENKAMQQTIGEIFKGIDSEGYIIYQAYNQIPDGKTSVKRYGFIQRPSIKR